MKMIKVLSIAALLSLSMQAFSEVAIIVHPDNPNTLTDRQVRKIYLGKAKAYPDGGEIQSFELDSDAHAQVRKTFLSKVVRRDESTYSSYWARMLFSSKAQPPVEVKSAAEMLTRVAANPNAIGYIDASKVDGTVKVLMTIQ